MKYVKSILENEKSHSVDWSSFPTLFKVVNKELAWDDLSEEQHATITEMCNQLCIHAAKGLANTPNDLTLVNVEAVDGPWGEDDLNDMAIEETNKGEANLDLLVFPTQTGDAEFDALYPDEKYVTVGFSFDVEVYWQISMENTIEDLVGEYRFVQAMVEGTWDSSIPEDLQKRVNHEITDSNEYTRKRLVLGDIKKKFPK